MIEQDEEDSDALAMRTFQILTKEGGETYEGSSDLPGRACRTGVRVRSGITGCLGATLRRAV